MINHQFRVKCDKSEGLLGHIKESINLLQLESRQDLSIRPRVVEFQKRLKFKPWQVYAKIRTLVWVEWDPETWSSDICISVLRKLEIFPIPAPFGLQR